MKKRFAPLLLAVLSLSSCATTTMVDRANGRPAPMDPPNLPPGPPNPAYYALIPLVLPFDLLAWPFQLGYLNRDQVSTYEPVPARYQPRPYDEPYRPTTTVY